MQYPELNEITDPSMDLSEAQRLLVEPLVVRVQVEYRTAIRGDRLVTDNDLLAILTRFATEVFRKLVPQDLSVYADSSSLRQSIALEGGTAETALRFAHSVYKNITRGRILWLWHKAIRDVLIDEIDIVEDRFWWQRAGIDIATTATQAEQGHAQTEQSNANAHGGSDAPIQEPKNNRERVEDFMDRMSRHGNCKVTKTMIWKMAGYSDRSQFQSFQRGERKNPKLERILRMSPADFFSELHRVEKK